MAHSVTGYTGYGGYSQGLQGFTSPTLGELYSGNVAPAYSTYDTSKSQAPYSGMLALSTPHYTSPFYSTSSSVANYQPQSYTTGYQATSPQHQPQHTLQQQPQQLHQQLHAQQQLHNVQQQRSYQQSYPPTITPPSTYDYKSQVQQHRKDITLSNYTSAVLPDKGGLGRPMLNQTTVNPSIPVSHTTVHSSTFSAAPHHSSSHSHAGHRAHSSQVFNKKVVNYNKMPFQKTNMHPHHHLCEICKVSCASAQTHKDHLEGQRHRKRLAQIENEKKEPTVVTGPCYKCELCDVTCTGEETFTAHLRGIKHNKAVKLYKELRKPIPEPTITGDSEPRPEVPIVGEELVEVKCDNSRSAKVYYCKMCDCSFNDEFAKNLHLKGRRHRLNYKKNYDPTLKVDIQPSKREKLVEQKARRKIEEAERRKNMAENRRHVWEQHRWRVEEEWREWAEARSWHQYEAMRKQQDKAYEQRCAAEKEHCKKNGLPMPPTPPRPNLPPPPPSMDNGRFICPGLDEFLMMQKQNMVSPGEEQLEALHDLVSKVEVALRAVSDTLAEETKEQVTAQGLTTTPARMISTIHRTGKLAKAILLTNDLTADIAVLCTDKPTQFMLQNIFSKFTELLVNPAEAKRKCRPEDGSFTVTLDSGETGPELKVRVKLTSRSFESTVTEDERRAECVAKVLERAHCLSTMEAINEAGWYKSYIKPNAAAVVVLRILTALKEDEPKLAILPLKVVQVLLHSVLRSFGPAKNVAPTLILRRFFEVLSTGLPLTEPMPSPWHQARSTAPDLIDKLEAQQLEDLTEYAQFAVRCLALGSLHKVLHVPPPPPSRLFHPPLNFRQRPAPAQ